MRPLYRPLALAVAAILAAGVLPALPVLAVAPTEAPAIVGPDGTSEPANPVLDWEPVSGATRYRVQVSAGPTFSTLEWSADVYATEAMPTKDLPAGTIFWRVAATDGGSGVGPYTSASFTREWHAAPVLLAPADEAVIDYPALTSADPDTRPDDTLPFRWEPMAGAKQYRIEIDDAPDFLNATAVTTDGTSYSPTELQTVGQAFYWHVQAISSNAALLSDWSETRSYRFRWDDLPELLTPEDDATLDRDIVFSWTPMAGATTYDLQVSPNGDWTNNVIHKAVVKGTRYSPIETLDNGSYYWRVRARDAKSTPNLGGWSEAWSFHVRYPDRVTLLAPADGDVFAEEPLFEWTAIPRAAWYEFQLSDDPNFTPSRIQQCFTTNTSFAPYRVGAPFTGSSGPVDCDVTVDRGVVWYWRVRGIDAEGGWASLWPQTGVDGSGFDRDWFTFTWWPTDVVLTAPDDGATITDAAPVLRWEPFQGAEKYRVVVLKASGGQAATVDTYATSWTPPGGLVGTDSPFTWTVMTLDMDGEVGIVGPTRSFSWSAPPTVSDLAQLTPSYDPADPTTLPQSETAPSLSWTPVTGATGYVVWYARRGGSFSPMTGGSTLAPTKIKSTAFTYATGALTTGIYDWYVAAYATNLQTQVSPVWSFGIRDLTLTTYLSPPDCVLIAECETLADTPTLDWDPVPGAGHYLVSIAKDPAFTNVIKTYKTMFSSLTPREAYLDSQAGQAYYWFVRPCRSPSVCGPFNSGVYANANAFRKQSLPVETLPVSDDGSVADQVVLSWIDYFETTTPVAPQSPMSYRVDVSTVSDFTTLLDTRIVDQTTYTPFDKTYPDGPLYWRVAAVDGSDNLLTYVAGQPLTKRSGLSLCGEPDVCAPAQDSQLRGVPSFTWAPQPYTAQYELEVYKNGDLFWSSSNRVIIQKTKLISWTPATALAPGLYAWRVRRLDPDQRAGVWTSGRTFTVIGDAPVLTDPADGSTAPEEIVFRWDPPTVPVPQYKLETSTSPVFSSTIESITTAMTGWAATKVYAKGTVYARVSSLNPRGVVLAVSDTISFTVGITTTVGAVSPVASAAVDGPWNVLFSGPVTGVSASTFTLKVAGGGASVPATVTQVQPSRYRLTPNAPLVVGQSYTASLSAAIKGADGSAIEPYSWTVRTALVADDLGPSITDAWDRDDTAKASGGSLLTSRLAGSSLVLPFTGTSVKVLATKGPSSGRATIWLDGAKVATVDLYRATTAWKQVVWSRTGMSNAKHRVEVRVLGTKATKSKDRWVGVDAFVVGSRTVQSTDAAVVATFARVATAGATGGTVEVTELVPAGDTGATPAWSVRFAGTGVAWYGITGPAGGCASVTIDGAPAGTVDLYSATTSGVRSVFAKGGLAAGEHVLRIVTIADKAVASTGNKVWLDRIEVQDGLAGLSVAGEPEAVVPSLEPSPDPSLEPDAGAVPEPSVEPAPTVEPEATQAPEPTQVPESTQAPEPTAEPVATAKPAPDPTPEATPAPDPTKAPRPDPTAEPDPEPEPTPEPKPEPDPKPNPEPDPEPAMAPDASPAP
jgi:hypothetical protein